MLNYLKLPKIATMIEAIASRRTALMASFCAFSDVRWNGLYTLTLPSAFPVSIERNDKSSGRMKATKLVNMIPPQDSSCVMASP